jgi:hypothetical protein
METAWRRHGDGMILVERMQKRAPLWKAAVIALSEASTGGQLGHCAPLLTVVDRC